MKAAHIEGSRLSLGLRTRTDAHTVGSMYRSAIARTNGAPLETIQASLTRRTRAASAVAGSSDSRSCRGGSGRHLI